ncbi:hypothetical protein [Actinopolymorpha sp. B9G3]|uniref:hypothetical protein n=1 Tax=Actinopolymorpha sp. B9G3 TaxID=3158970 RepID=UPI0032D994F8
MSTACVGGGLAGCACGVCLDFGALPGLGPCPACRPDAYTEHVCTLDALNQASKQSRHERQANPKLQTRKQPITRSEP